MSEIERKPNALKFESSNSSDAVLVSIGFLSDITSPVEDAVLAYLASIKGQAVLSWEEDYLCFGSNIRESLFNIELTSSIVPETLAAIPVRDVKAAMRWLLLRKTAAGDVACKTPDAATGANVSKVCSVNSEICITDPAKYKTKKTLIAPILVHKTLLEERKTNPGGIYNALFRDAFAVAGGYDGKEVCRFLNL
ncbi:MAG TPA: hypothetical protein DFJ59_05245 [Alphaproteobacteria bacterium]|nr:hypothetical protein [Alphaproteobacteria bacterium]